MNKNSTAGRNPEILSSTLYTVLGLGAITLLALGLRFFRLGEWSFWIDEIYTINRSLQELSLLTPLSLRLISLTFDFFPVSEWSARLAPAIIGVITIPILFFPIRRVFNLQIAFVSVLLIAVSTVHLFWSQNARYYIALMLFYNLALFLFYLWIESDKLLYLVLTFLFLGLALLERLVALYILPVMGVYLVLIILMKFEKPKGFRLRNLFLFLVPILIGGLILFIPEITNFRTRFLVHSSNPFRLLSAVVFDLGLPVFIVAFLGGYYSFKEKDRAGLLMITSAVVPLAILLVLAPFSFVNSRYFFATLPSWIILAAIVIVKLFENGQFYAKSVSIILLLILITDSISQDVLYYGYQNGNRADWKGAYHLVGQSAVEGDMIVSSRSEIGRYYLGRNVVPSQAIVPENIINEKRTAWFVLDNQTGNVPQKLQTWLNEHASLKSVRDVSLPGKTFEMRVFLYQP